MALVYEATLVPSKLELLAAWLPTRLWFEGSGELERIGSYRFDDPAGEVGIEAILVRAVGSDVVFHVPLTYRGAPLVGADAHLVGTMEHSVLGRRWIYDGCGDPVALGAAAVRGEAQADVEIEVEGRMVTMPAPVSARGTGTSGTDVDAIDTVRCHDDGSVTRITAGPYEVVVARVAAAGVTGTSELRVAWDGREPVALVGVMR
jgi:hypothetical protein